MKHKVIFTFICTIIIFCFSSKYDSIVNAQDGVELEVDPDSVLFDVNNMKPGDWASRDVKIKNRGTRPFMYSINVESRGMKKLYNELQLEVFMKKRELYSGELNSFTNIKARHLAPGKQDNITVTIRFPEELGNEYQGLEADFAIIIIAEGEAKQQDEQTVIGKIGTDKYDFGSKLPNTATNTFVYILLGLCLIGIGIFLYLVIRKYKKIKQLKI